MRVLTVNAGSSSLKLSVLDATDVVVAERHLKDWDGDGSALAELAQSDAVDVVAHRVVHGGAAYDHAVLIDDDVRRAVEELTELAPLHQPPALAMIDKARASLPDLPHVACFDTAFHRTMPAAASTYALPQEWRDRWDLRRFGFHGLSHAYVARRAPRLAGRPAPRLVSCHLGAGASLCAIADGRSVDTTMGFTPLDGLVMATRPGSVDPGILLHLLDAGMSPATLRDGLLHRSGLAGLAGDADLRVVLDAAGSGDARAALAVEIYVRRVAAGVSAMTAALGGIDLLAFTAGAGEHASVLRADICRRLAYLGVELDDAANTAAYGDAVVTADGARVATVVLTAREDLEMARETRSLLESGEGHAP